MQKSFGFILGKEEKGDARAERVEQKSKKFRKEFKFQPRQL